MVGLRRRVARRLWLPLHGPPLLGAGLALSAVCRSGRPAGAPRFPAAMADGAVSLSRAQSESARETHLVSRQTEAGIPRSGATQEVGEWSVVHGTERQDAAGRLQSPPAAA